MSPPSSTDRVVATTPTSSSPDIAVEPLLAVRDLRVRFRTARGVVHATEGVSYDLFGGEVLGVVGESGSGKTVSAMAVLGLLPANAEVTGEVRFRGRDLVGLPPEELRAVRGQRIAMVFQDALAALNPLHRIGSQIAEAITAHHSEVTRRQLRERTVQLLSDVGIPNPVAAARRYPHEFSGGMRQRAVIAMALANDPEVIIADEPTTALDVTTQAQVLDVLERMRARTGSAMVLITHNLGVVTGVADRVLVMYAGKVVESGGIGAVFTEPAHPYTIGLLASMPRLDQDGGRLVRIAGQPPSLVDVPPGCAFHPRCPHAQLPGPCATDVPDLRPASATGHCSACHFADDLTRVSSSGAPSEPRG